MSKIFSRLFIFIPISFIFFACTTLSFDRATDENITYNENEYIPEKFDWEKSNDFIDYFIFENKNIPVRYVMTRINLASEQIKLCYYPEVYETENLYYNDISVKNFSKKNDCAIAINATQFSYKNLIKNKVKLEGIYSIDGTIFSKAIPRYSAIKLSRQEKGYKGEILVHQDNIAEEESFIIGGFFTILKDGELFDSTGKNFSYTSHDSRTAVAFSKDGSILYILVVEGEKKNRSKGLSYPECAKLFKAVGGYSAIEFDGGSSSAIFLQNKNILTYTTLRNTGCCIGFCDIKNL